MEVLIILLVAFIFLGPNQMVDAARLLGKAAREVRRLTAELPDLTLDRGRREPDRSPHRPSRRRSQIRPALPLRTLRHRTKTTPPTMKAQ